MLTKFHPDHNPTTMVTIGLKPKNVTLVAHSATCLGTIAFILQLLISVGAPIWHAMYFFQTPLDNQQIRMGTWGLCTSQQCDTPSLGYTWFAPVQEHVPQMKKKRDVGAGQGLALITPGSTQTLILHPIATLLCFVSILLSLRTWIQWHHVGGECSKTL